MDILTQIFAFLVTILLLVSIHEAGHMFVARAFNIKVLRYSIGFGKSLWHHRSKKSGTEYVIALLPLGGYVKLLDEREGAVPEEEKHRAFNRQSLGVRTAVVAAGPLINIVFAIFIYWIMFSVGIDSVRPIVGQVSPHSLASKVGIQSGDLITKIDGHAVQGWQDITLSMIARLGEQGQLTMETRSVEGVLTQHRVPLPEWVIDPLNPDPLRSFGLEPYRPAQPAVVDSVKEGSPAELAGVKAGDHFVAIDGKPLKDWYDLVKTVQPHPGKTFDFLIDREGQKLNIRITAESQLYLRGFQRLGVIGVKVKPTEYPKEMKFERKYNILAAIVPATSETLRIFNFNFIVLKKLIKGEISLKTLSGPITIFSSADRAFKAGFMVFLSFLALISVMLAFLNVLPIPGLDGGHIAYFLVEFILRRPLPPAVEIFTMRLGLVLLLLLTMAATYNDILRLLQ